MGLAGALEEELTCDVLGRRRRGWAGIFAQLWMRAGADVAGGGREGVQKLRMAGARLTLSTPAENAAPSDEHPCQDNGEDGRQTGAERRPMYVDEGKSIIGLVKVDVTGLVVDAVINGEAGIIFHVDGWGSSG